MIVCMVKILEIFKGDFNMWFDVIIIPTEVAQKFTNSGLYKECVSGAGTSILINTKSNEKEKAEEKPENKEC